MGISLRTRSAVLLALISITVISLFGGAAAAPLPAPQIDREASEELLLSAYGHFINNRLWNCLDDLDRAAEENIYLVDAYYMRALAYRRLGMYPEAIAAMSNYMEVRREDPRVQTIIGAMREEWDMISSSASPDGTTASLLWSARTINDQFGVPVNSLFALRGMQGLGKMAVDGASVIVADAYGDSVHIFDGPGEPVSVPMPMPMAVVIQSRSEYLAFTKSGDLTEISYSGETRTVSLDVLGRVDADVSDAVLVCGTLLAVSDRTGQSVKFYRYPSLELTREWAPDDVDSSIKLFEPSALDVYGPFVAIADRANERVFVIDAYTLKERARFDADSPRDLQWGDRGELYVLSDAGTLYEHTIFSDLTTTREVAVGMPDAWCVANGEDGPIVCDIVGRIWWVSRTDPGNSTTVGAMSLVSPWLEDRLDAEALMVRISASSLYQSFIQGKQPVIQAIWRGEQRPARIIDTQSPQSTSFKVYAPSFVPAVGAIGTAGDISSVIKDLADISRAGRELPRVLVLDTGIKESEDEVSRLFAFLMHQGIRLDLWARSRTPSLSMQYVSRMTRGRTYTSESLLSVPPNTNCEWVLTIPLPPDTYTYGYPSETTLSVYADIDVIRFIDWMPIWPALLKKR